MAALRGGFGILVGMAIALAGVVMVLLHSPLLGTGGDMESVFLWSIIFLFGIMILGWGMAKLVTP